MGLVHWVWLGLALPPGSEKTDLVLRRFPDPQEFYEAGESGMAEIEELSGSEVIRIRATTLDVAKKALDRAQDFGAKVYCQADREYPARLLNTAMCPPALYVLGSIKGANRAITVAMVGSRNCSDYGRRAAAQISSGLARAGAVVVSGLAAGIDTVSHTACLDAGGRTYAVMGCGVGSIYPAENAGLKERIIEHGAVISQFPPDAKPHSSFFPIRNRVVSGLSCGVCVVEAALRSGTSITANLAIEQGRDVFAVPNDVFKVNAQGTLELLKEGATPVSAAGDILSVYARRYPDRVLRGGESEPEGARIGKEQELRRIRREPPQELSPNARALYDLLERRSKYVEELCAETGFTASETAAALTELEIFGLAEHVPGRRFRLG